ARRATRAGWWPFGRRSAAARLREGLPAGSRPGDPRRGFVAPGSGDRAKDRASVRSSSGWPNGDHHRPPTGDGGARRHHRHPRRRRGERAWPSRGAGARRRVSLRQAAADGPGGGAGVKTLGQVWHLARFRFGLYLLSGLLDSALLYLTPLVPALIVRQFFDALTGSRPA